MGIYQMTSRIIKPDAGGEIDLELVEVLAWLAKTGVAGSALGRAACGNDHALMTRWKRGGCQRVSRNKRDLVLTYIREHPNGIPGYTPGKIGSHRKKGITYHGPREASRVGHAPKDGGDSTTIPVPSITTLQRRDDIEWVKAQAFSRGVPFTTVLAEMVEIGIKCAREDEYEASRPNEEQKHGHK